MSAVPSLVLLPCRSEALNLRSRATISGLRRTFGQGGRTAVVCCRRQTGSANTMFSMWPMPSISTRITSPTFRNDGGFIPAPTPDGVPVARMSPGSSVITVD